jgi:site-specific DNA-methyltransferase (adenine-specific)
MKLFRSRRGNDEKEVYFNPKHIKSNKNLVDKYKVVVSKASPGGDEYPHSVFSRPFIAPPESAFTETYLLIDFFDNESEAINLTSYLKTRFFRFLVLMVKTTQNISKGSFALVPCVDLSEKWTDEKLNMKYGLDEEEIFFINNLVKSSEIYEE